MKLNALLQGISYECIRGDEKTEVGGLTYDSRKILPSDVFVCIRGASSDGHRYIETAAQKGAAAVIVEDAEVSIASEYHITVIYTKSTRRALAYMSANFFGHPANELVTIGITGTKGKTTTAFLIREILEAAGKKTGLIGTIETIIGDRVIPADNTTPESYVVQRYFREMVSAGCEFVVMEVSSQGLMQERVSGFTFDYAVFTNLEPDHIGANEHSSFDEYAACKAKLFQNCKTGIFNYDDVHIDRILSGHTCTVESYGLEGVRGLKADNLRYHTQKGDLCVTYDTTGVVKTEVTTAVPGKFSVYNSLAALAVCSHFNLPNKLMTDVIRKVKVHGRVETVPVSDKYSMVVDYAHNAMSLKCLLETLRMYQPKRLVCVFGCGGNRSKDRRFEMGEVAATLADLVVVTSDNPRYEKPEDIIADIITGVERKNGTYITVPDREKAITYCMEHAQEGDLIVVAGKGHEDYQEIAGIKYPMDDCTMIKKTAERIYG